MDSKKQPLCRTFQNQKGKGITSGERSQTQQNLGCPQIPSRGAGVYEYLGIPVNPEARWMGQPSRVSPGLPPSLATAWPGDTSWGIWAQHVGTNKRIC